MTNQEIAVEVEKVWPKTFVNVCEWYEVVEPKETNVCFDCERPLHLSSNDTYTFHSTGQGYEPREADNQDEQMFCDNCGKPLTELKPNPWAIPSEPSIYDVKISVGLTRALSSVVYKVCVPKQCDKNDGMWCDPSYFNWSHDQFSPTWNEWVYEVMPAIEEFKLTDQYKYYEKSNVTRLVNLIGKEFTTGLARLVNAREEAIKKAQEKATSCINAKEWQFRVLGDDSRHCGYFHVGAFDIAPQRDGEEDWSYDYRLTRAANKTDIRVYVNVVDSMPVFEFQQRTNEGDVVSDSIEAAIGAAITYLTRILNKTAENSDNHVLYAIEALADAGIDAVNASEEVK